MTTSALAALRASVEAYAIASWEQVYDPGTLTIAGASVDPAGLAIWARLSINFGQGTFLTMGRLGSGTGGANELAGTVLVQVFARSDSGYGDLVAATDVVRDAFNRIEIAGATFGPPAGGNPGPDPDDEAWAMTMVSLPFSFIDSLG